jgi:hypothetical protein
VTRKSFKVMPGVRMTVSKSGVSTSVGVKGAHISRSTSGRTTKSVGIPGTGISHVTSHTSGSKSRTASAKAQAAASQQPEPVKPGMFAPKWEEELYKAIVEGHYDDLPGIAGRHPEAAPVAATMDGLVTMQKGDNARALVVCRWAWSTAGDVGSNPFVVKYIGQESRIGIGVATGVTAVLPIGRDALGLALAELEQEAGNLDAAIDVVEQLEPSAVAAVSLAELYLTAGRYDDVISLTDGVVNVDDPTALLAVFRGSAFREQELYTASREAFKDALKSKSRAAEIRHKGLVERSQTYVADGKPAMARKDLERVLAEDASLPEVRKLLAELN